ncbi:phage shock protein A (PspA) family protein [Desulfonatronum thiosulfatophilum]|uniref:Phage shock protein A (PspA) family protein n=1 Tax=Desulfonatronum thiosulfatophilum TaxID=617002 RepID=A0A1G6D2G3_9BACT|nr:PspA/IM30 family protein [Desulfonatronum thiosulfatophilum]SDB39363.1 phage shock protein A (PspA) family protein [Desulfonatronum thiosulfatophilum]
MGIFNRFRDIISSNINSMLERAEDPKKLLRLMIQEMEETLVELKASCAGAMAATVKIRREWEMLEAKAAGWQERAGLAVEKGHEDLAREALMERRRLESKKEIISRELIENERIIDGYKADLTALEEKLLSAKEKQRLLVQRHIRAKDRKRVGSDLRKADSQVAMMRFEEFEQRIDRMEAEAEMAGPWVMDDRFRKDRKEESFTLEEKFAKLEVDEDIEREIEALRMRNPARKQEDSPN